MGCRAETADCGTESEMLTESATNLAQRRHRWRRRGCRHKTEDCGVMGLWEAGAQAAAPSSSLNGHGEKACVRDVELGKAQAGICEQSPLPKAHSVVAVVNVSFGRAEKVCSKVSTLCSSSDLGLGLLRLTVSISIHTSPQRTLI
jgi:hypothetical protein